MSRLPAEASVRLRLARRRHLPGPSRAPLLPRLCPSATNSSHSHLKNRTTRWASFATFNLALSERKVSPSSYHSRPTVPAYATSALPLTFSGMEKRLWCSNAHGANGFWKTRFLAHFSVILRARAPLPCPREREGARKLRRAPGHSSAAPAGCNSAVHDLRCGWLFPIANAAVVASPRWNSAFIARRSRLLPSSAPPAPSAYLVRAAVVPHRTHLVHPLPRPTRMFSAVSPTRSWTYPSHTQHYRPAQHPAIWK
ncbi:hypothetical protein C8R44DRAFT_883456 [Mycena epipterygia]|nr:hypothetical protein C8R44DRAFT_883456 [Mycena epipterygia]